MGKVEGGMKCVKYLLFVFNFIFWLMGSFVLAVGLWLRFDPETVSLLNDNKAPDTFFLGVYILIGAGSLIMLVGFFGCCGAVRESQCLLGSFFACLLIIFGSEVAAGVFGFLNKDKVHFFIECLKSSRCFESGSNTTDCESRIEEFFNNKLYIIGYVGIGIAGVMIIGMIFSMVLCCAVRNSREVI
uniref:Tetraspanin 2b n=1 Tax=Nothobranchius furzeri TaxID=105023 RepID=A0A8C6L332_NOTFU